MELKYVIEVRDAAGTVTGYVDVHSKRPQLVADAQAATLFFDPDDADALIDTDAVKALAAGHVVGVAPCEVES